MIQMFEFDALLLKELNKGIEVNPRDLDDFGLQKKGLLCHSLIYVIYRLSLKLWRNVECRLSIFCNRYRFFEISLSCSMFPAIDLAKNFRF